MMPTETAVSRISSRSGQRRRADKANRAVAPARRCAGAESAVVKSGPRPCPLPKKKAPKNIQTNTIAPTVSMIVGCVRTQTRTAPNAMPKSYARTCSQVIVQAQ